LLLSLHCVTFCVRFGWIIGIGTYIGQTKGVVYTRSEGGCPTDATARSVVLYVITEL
jgi:hypothetical protein